jgi:hypothetical protein
MPPHSRLDWVCEKKTSFIGGELNSTTGSGLVNITGAYANSTVTPSGGTYSCSANTNINCGPLSVGNGGTGNATQTAHAVLLGEGTSPQAFATIGTAGRLMVDQGSGTDPAFVAAGGDCSTTFSTTVNFNCTKTNGTALSAGATNSAAAEQARLALTVLTSCITAVNFNSANTDHAIAFTLPTGFTRMIPFRVTIQNASHTFVTATLGLFSATAGGGVAIIAAGTAITVSTASDATVNNTQTLGATSTAAFVGANLSPASTVQFRVGTEALRLRPMSVLIIGRGRTARRRNVMAEAPAAVPIMGAALKAVGNPNGIGGLH